MSSSKYYYAVKVGRKPGIYNSWAECSNNILHYSGAIYKKFDTYDEAMNFINNDVKKTKKVKKETKNITDNLNGLHAYIDGSFSVKKCIAGYGAVILNDGNIIEKLSGSCTEYISMRNVVGELFAAIHTINWAIDNKYSEITLHYDYAGIENWALGIWKTEKEGTKNYKKFIDEKLNIIKINFVKVKGHSGDFYNDMADALAKESIDIK